MGPLVWVPVMEKWGSAVASGRSLQEGTVGVEDYKALPYSSDNIEGIHFICFRDVMSSEHERERGGGQGGQ